MNKRQFKKAIKGGRGNLAYHQYYYSIGKIELGIGGRIVVFFESKNTNEMYPNEIAVYSRKGKFQFFIEQI